MDKKHIRKEIAALINSIKEHSDSIGDKEQIPQLELELILHKIEKLYQKSIVYNHLSSQDTAVIQPEKKEEKIIVPVAKVEAPEVKTPVVENLQPEIKKEEVKEVKKEEPKTEVKPEIKSVDLFGSELPPAAEKVKAEKKPLEKKDNPAQIPVSKIQKPSITDIRSAIGINDRFQFANELFGGEMQEYEIAIQQLNTAETMESAAEYFMSLQQLYSWNNEDETVKRLFDLVERRYS